MKNFVVFFRDSTYLEIQAEEVIMQSPTINMATFKSAGIVVGVFFDILGYCEHGSIVEEEKDARPA